MLRAFVSVLLTCLFAAGAHSDPSYPNRTVKVVVPYGPGGAVDVLARMVAQELSTRLGQQFIVENQGGMGGSLGTGNVAKASPDGYTLLFGSEAPLVINPHIYPSLSYDPVSDFAPITILVRTAYYVVVCPKLPISSLKELVEHGRKQHLSYASAGFGTTMNLAGEMLKRDMKFDMTHVPYKSVSASYTDVVGCNVDVVFGAYNSAIPLIKAGKVKALAVSTESRAPATPEVPTLREAGLADMEQIESSFNVMAPAKTPRPIIDRLHKEIVTIMNSAEMKKQLDARGMILMTSETPEAFAAWIEATSKRYKDIVTSTNIRIQ